jgi:hypothetical protein
MRPYLRLNLILLLFLSATVVNAHTPLDTGGGNISPETALEIDNPTKSWTIYEILDEVDYYKMHLHEGEELRVSVYVSIWGDDHFTPSLVVIGPDIVGIDEPPFEHPENLGRVIIQGERPSHTEYEPFTPASYYYVAYYSHLASVDGDYYLAVYSTEHGGRYGMALGYRETFTLFQWIKIPLDLVSIHLWEQQPLILLFGPPCVVIVVGLYHLFIREKSQEDIPQILGRIAGVLFIASGVMTLTQMLVYLVVGGFAGSALLTLVFVVVQLGLGYFVVHYNGMTWVAWIVLGLGGLVFWAGWIFGPVLALGVGVFQKLDTGYKDN